MALSSEVVTPNGERRWNLLWTLRLTSLYHRKRERFLDGVDSAAKAITVLGGAAAFAQIQQHPKFGLWVVGVIALISTLSLVYSPGTKARRHAELARDFKRLEAKFLAEEKKDLVGALDKCEEEYTMLEATEPATLGALVTQCHNEMAVAHDRRDLVTPLPRHQRVFKNWVDFDQSIDPQMTPYARATAAASAGSLEPHERVH